MKIDTVTENDPRRDQLYAILLAATETAGESLKITGISFVLAGINLWFQELAEVDKKQTAKMFQALSDMASGKTSFENAEKRRHDAARALMAIVDQMMEEERAKAQGGQEAPNPTQ